VCKKMDHLKEGELAWLSQRAGRVAGCVEGPGNQREFRCSRRPVCFVLEKFREAHNQAKKTKSQAPEIPCLKNRISGQAASTSSCVSARQESSRSAKQGAPAGVSLECAGVAKGGGAGPRSPMQETPGKSIWQKAPRRRAGGGGETNLPPNFSKWGRWLDFESAAGAAGAQEAGVLPLSHRQCPAGPGHAWQLAASR
jgi:hypothetical protein